MTDFSPPGPGQWNLDRSHYPGGTTPISTELIERSMAVGMGRVMSELGSPASAVRAAFVNGFMYTRLEPLISPNMPPRRLPPNIVLKLATRLHPEFRRRNSRAAANLAHSPAPRVVAEWEGTHRPRVVAANRRFQAVDLSALDDAALADHFDELMRHAHDTFELHFWLHGYDLGPIAQYVARLQSWAIDPAVALSALVGASPSTTEPRQLLAAIRREVATDTARLPGTLAEARAKSPMSAELLDRYLADRRHVLVTRYDIDGLTLGELPEVVLASILSATDEAPDDGAAAVQAVRQLVNDEHRQEFDRLVAAARHVMDMRDDNGPITTEWPAGLLRRAVLEVGRRLTAMQRAATPEHAFELRSTEVGALLRRGDGPGRTELAQRAERRAAQVLLDPPVMIGTVEATPPLEVLPGPLREVVGAIQAAFAQLGMSGEATAGDPLSGSGIGTTVYRGRVRRASSPEEAIDTMEPGDVLVVRATSPAFNVILSIAGAIVTSDGGPMSHAAVLARELGIPAVVGARGALALPDGAMVEVDPVLNVVRLL